MEISVSQANGRIPFSAPTLKLLNPTKNAAKALSVSGYDMFLKVYTNADEAIRSF